MNWARFHGIFSVWNTTHQTKRNTLLFFDWIYSYYCKCYLYSVKSGEIGDGHNFQLLIVRIFSTDCWCFFLVQHCLTLFKPLQSENACYIFIFLILSKFWIFSSPLSYIMIFITLHKCADKSQMNADITVMNSIQTKIIIIDKSLIHWMEYIDRISDDSTCLACIVMSNVWLLSLKEWMRAPYQVTI